MQRLDQQTGTGDNQLEVVMTLGHYTPQRAFSGLHRTPPATLGERPRMRITVRSRPRGLGRLADERQWNATVRLVNVGPNVALSDVRTVLPYTRSAAARWARLGL